jgi:hypothetical protein
MRLPGIAGDFGRTDCGAMYRATFSPAPPSKAEAERETDISFRDEA